MPPPVNEALPPSQWTGTYFDSGAWACQLTCSWPAAQRAAHEGKASENVRLFNFRTQAEAAAAFDLLAIWRQSQLGKPLTAKPYNLGLQRYREHTAALIACRSLQAAREHVRQLKDSGAIATLAAGVPSPPPSPFASAGSGSTKRKRGGSGMAEDGETGGDSTEEEEEQGSSSGEEEEEGGSSGGEEEEAGVSSSGGEEGGEEEESEAAEPAPKLARAGGGRGRGRGGRGRGRGAASLSPAAAAAASGGSAGFHSIVAAPPGWACQVHVSHGRLTGKYREEVLSAAGKTNVRVGSFGSTAEAAAAGDLALQWRCQAYGSDASEQDGALNFVAAGYKREPGAGMLRRVMACASGEVRRPA
ncbi:hypothetical protein ABPG75_006585 [Micractinium tetrahymenae]